MVLFKPGVALQTRELNTLQSMLQNQIEKFGDNIFTKGTIINGCNFIYYDNYPYVKIKDLQVDGLEVTLGNYVNLFAKNSSNLVSYILTANSGFESQDPDLNTLFIKYLNSGTNSNTSSYASSDVLTIYDSNNSIFSVTVPVGGTGSGFSNSDSVVFVPAIVVNTTSGGFTNAELLTDPGTGARAQIIEVNTTAIASSTVLKLKPLAVDVANTSKTANAWTFYAGNTIQSNTTSSVGTVYSVIGSGASASPVTDGAGRVNDVLMVTQGTGYTIIPHTTIKPANTSADVNGLSISSRNYAAQVTVSTVANAVGSGYAFGVSEGVVYQKGYFLYVAPQTVVVSKYTNVPDELYVGFNTSEALVNSNIDPELLDNATGTFNEKAPGADRLLLTPNLMVLNASSVIGNTLFFPITGFSLGRPFLQNQQTSYNQIGDDMARRTYDTSGNFVLDPFILSTKSSVASADEPTNFRVVIDPGEAYISGYHVKTYSNFGLDITQGTDTRITPSVQVNMNYGSYVLVKELGGTFQFATNDYVTLYDTAKSFLSTATNFATGAISSAGSAIGTARMRSLVLDSGTPGTPSAQYRLYLYDIQMNAGKNFRSVNSIYYNGSTYKAVADTVLALDPSTSANVATLVNANTSKMVFNVGPTSIKTVNNISYIYKNIKTANAAGVVSLTLTGSESWPYTTSSNLSSTQLQDLIVVPLANAQRSANAAGSYVVAPNATGNATQSLITANAGTSNFITSFAAGDYLKVWANATTLINYARVVAVANSTAMLVAGNSATLTSNGQSNIVIFYPNNVPISLVGRTGAFANVNNTGQLLTINLGATFSANIDVAVETNIKVTNASANPKTTQRDTYVKINFSNAIASNTGPWTVGIPDIFRMKRVYVANSATVLAATNTTATGLRDVTNHFYIDHNQMEDYYDYGYLYKKPTSNLALYANMALLVGFDHFTNSSTGFFTRQSYNSNDSLSFTTLDATKSGGSINTLEIPEMQGYNGSTFDMIDTVDFRPRVIAAANVSNANVANSTVNPVEANAIAKFSSAAVVGFPTPDSVFTANVEYYLGRVDRVVVDKNGNIKAIKGVPNVTDLVAPNQPADSLTINTVYVPPYPSVPRMRSSNLTTIIDKKIASEVYSTRRVKSHTINVPVLNDTLVEQQQPTRYTVSDLHILERRIEALEYYVSLSLLEQSVKSLVIPSSLNGSLNRFKYGFFADKFDSDIYTSTDNPEYSADFRNNEVVPKQNIFNYEFKFGDNSSNKILLLPYTSANLINQTIATDGAYAAPPPAVVYNGVLTPDPRTFTLITKTARSNTSSGGVYTGNGERGNRSPVSDHGSSYGSNR